MNTTRTLWRKATVWLVIVGALLAVFALYVQPDFLVMVADQLWACF